MPRKNLPARAIDGFVDALGGKDELVAVLRESDDPIAEKLLNHLTSPSFDQHAPATLCRRLGITVRELQAFYANTQKGRALMEAAKALPRVVRDTFVDAQSQTKTCLECYGEGTIFARRKERKCPACDGIGQVRVAGSVANRKLAFEITGLIKQGPLIQTNLTFDKAVLIAPGEPPLESVAKNVQRLIREAEERTTKGNVVEVATSPDP